jgi:hypothetical protein
MGGMPLMYFHAKYDPAANRPTRMGTVTPIPALAPVERPSCSLSPNVQFVSGIEELTPTMNIASAGRPTVRSTNSTLLLLFVT